ncbi:MAG: hypothetical protein AAF612_07555 [Planctomycetota bacterium]
MSMPAYLLARYLQGLRPIDQVNTEYEMVWMVGVPVAIAVAWLQWFGWALWMRNQGKAGKTLLLWVTPWSLLQIVALLWVAYSYARDQHAADVDWRTR